MPHSFRRRTRETRGIRATSEILETRTLLTAGVVPLPVNGVVATGTSASSIALSWDASADPSVTGYNVIEKVWVPGGYKTQGHWTYPLRASDITASNDVVSGLATGSSHIFFVTALNSAGQSLNSVPVVGQTWAAPSFTNSPSMFLLSSGAVCSGSVNATAGMTTQIKLLVSGNPLTYSLVPTASPFAAVEPDGEISASTQLAITNALVFGASSTAIASLASSSARPGWHPSNASINSRTGVVTYTPSLAEVGMVQFTFRAANALGTVTQTIQFNVTAQDPTLTIPTLKLTSNTSTFNGQYQPFSVVAFGADGQTPVSGTVALAYDGTVGNPRNVGTYQVLATFTSADPAYGNATLLSTVTMGKTDTSFSYLDSPTIAAGTATTTISGYVQLGEYASPVSASGEYVILTLNGVSEAAAIGANSNFSATFDTSALTVGSDAISLSYSGDLNHNPAPDGTTTLDVIPTAPPQITANPHNAITSAGDGASFTAEATGTPDPIVQWQLSADGGNTWANVTGNTSATTPTLIFTTTTLAQNNYKYRAVFSNYLGTAITSSATLTIEPAD